MSYQRFESQKIVGRYYPWSSTSQIQNQKRKFYRTRSHLEEIRDKEKNRMCNVRNFPENEKILRRFHSEQMTVAAVPDEISASGQKLEHFSSPIITATTTTTATETNSIRKSESTISRQENEKHCERNKKTSMEQEQKLMETEQEKRSSNPIFANVTDDEKLNSCQKPSYDASMDEVDLGEDINAIVVIEEISLDSQYAMEHTVEDMEFDTVPDKPPPPLPSSVPPPTPTIPPLSVAGGALPPTPPPLSGFSLDGTTKSRNLDSVNANTWQQYLNNPMKRLSTIKDMLVMNAELYIKEHVPHPPRILIQRTLSREQRQKDEVAISRQRRRQDTCSRGDYKNDISAVSPPNQMNSPLSSSSPSSSSSLPSLSSPPNAEEKHLLERPTNVGGGGGDGEDTVDFFLPTRRRMIKGVEQDDFIAKFVSFFGWIMFIFMRMIALSVFSFFYLKEFLYLICAHYALMLICLIYESRLKKKIERILFYVFLAYVYVFVILEFRIKFKHLRLWYFGYFTFVMLQNFIGTILWYTTKEFHSWWFGFLFNAIIVSGLLCLSCMIVYYCILKPNDVILLETE